MNIIVYVQYEGDTVYGTNATSVYKAENVYMKRIIFLSYKFNLLIVARYA